MSRRYNHNKSGGNLANKRRGNRRYVKNKGKNFRKRDKSRNISAVNKMTEISMAPIQVRSMRYRGTSITDFNMERDFLFSLLEFGVSGSTTSYSLIQSARLRAVSVTCLPTSDVNAGSFGFTWEGARTPVHTETMFYSQGVPAKATFVPPEESLAAFWHNITDDDPINTILFNLESNNNVVTLIVDLHIEYILDSLGSSMTRTISAPTSSGIYARRLPSVAGGYLIPVGIASMV